MKTNNRGLLAAVAVVLSVPAMAQTTKQQPVRGDSVRESGKARGAILEEVVVSAQKREEKIQDVPISISVLSGEQMDSATDRGTADALNRVPGTVSLGTGTRTGNTGGIVVIRGVAPTIGASVTAFYLDSIPFGFVRNSFAPDVGPYDLERVEVLRGPQGTLYGLSALNGVVRVLTKDADLEKFELKGRASASSTEHGSESYRGDVAVNVPIVEGKLAARAVLGYQDRGGWIDKSFEEDSNDSQIENYRLKLKAQPTEDFSASLLAWRSRSDNNSIQGSEDGLRSLSQVKEPSSVDYDAYSLQLGYNFSAVTLTAATSYIDFQNHGKFDFSPLTAATSYLNTKFDSKVFAQEILLSSSSQGLWRWSLGGIYRDAEEYNYTNLTNPATGAWLFLAPLINRYYSESFALFGEITRMFLDGQLELTGGLRYFEDDARDKELSRIILGGVPPTGLVSEQNSFDKVTPRVVLTWHPNQQATLYVSYAEGFRSGLNQSPTVVEAAPQYPSANPDDLKNYELGTKATFWDGRLNLEAAVFYIDWQDVQQQVAVNVAPAVILPAVINAESKSGAGFEFGATVSPLDSLTLGLNFSWNDLTQDKDVLTGGNLLIPKGSRGTSSPEYSVGGSIDYTMFRSSAGWRGRFFTTGNYTPEVIGFYYAATATSPVRTISQDAFWMVNAALSLDAPGGWTASLFAENLTNDEGLGPDPFSPRWNNRLRPRTIGLQFEYMFR